MHMSQSSTQSNGTFFKGSQDKGSAAKPLKRPRTGDGVDKTSGRSPAKRKNIDSSPAKQSKRPKTSGDFNEEVNSISRCTVHSLASNSISNYCILQQDIARAMAASMETSMETSKLVVGSADEMGMVPIDTMKGITNRNPHTGAVDRCFISAALVALSRANGFRGALDTVNGHFFVELKSILQRLEEMSSVPIDAKSVFLKLTEYFVSEDGSQESLFMIGQGDSDEFVAKLMDKMREEDVATSDVLTSFLVVSESQSSSPEDHRSITEVTPEAVLKMSIPDKFQGKRLSARTQFWPNVRLDEMLRKACTDLIDEDASSTIKRKVIRWNRYVLSPNTLVLLLNRHCYGESYKDLFYNHSKINLHQTFEINGTEFALKSLVLHHGNLSHGHYTAIVIEKDGILHVDDENVYRSSDTQKVLGTKYVRARVTAAVYERVGTVNQTDEYKRLRQLAREGTLMIVNTSVTSKVLMKLYTNREG